MLPKQHRLHGHKIPEIIKRGIRYQSSIAVLILNRKNSLSLFSEFTTIIPSRLSKKANKRNRTKRLLNEAISKNLKQVRPGFEVIVMAKKILEKEKLQEIQPEIDSLLKKAKMIIEAK